MVSLRRHLLVASAVLLASWNGAAWAQGAMIGILEGKATLVRQAAKFALAEGVALQNEDIVETPAGAFVQIEFPDGVRMGVGPGTKLMLAPRGPTRGTPPRAYLMQGWVKLTQPTDKPVAGTLMTPQFEVGPVSGASIMASGPKEFALFVESGNAKVADRAGGAPLALGPNSYLSAKAGDKPEQAARPSPDFLAQMPRPFRDPLPARAARFRDNPTTPKGLGDVAYEDVAVWVSAEPGLRSTMVERWRPRLKDKPFRAAMIANLAAHPEWDPLLFPEKLAKKKAEEKRAREARAAAAAASAAAAAQAAAQAAASVPRAPD